VVVEITSVGCAIAGENTSHVGCCKRERGMCNNIDGWKEQHSHLIFYWSNHFGMRLIWRTLVCCQNDRGRAVGGSRALRLAVKFRHVDIVDELSSNDVDLDSRDENGFNLLRLETLNEDTSVLEYLLREGRVAGSFWKHGITQNFVEREWAIMNVFIQASTPTALDIQISADGRHFTWRWGKVAWRLRSGGCKD
jgi:hypothetical protein